MRQLDIGDDQVRNELLGRVESQAAVGHGLRFVAVRCEKVAEQLDVEGVVLDNQDLGQSKRSPTLSQNDLSYAGSLDK